MKLLLVPTLLAVLAFAAESSLVKKGDSDEEKNLNGGLRRGLAGEEPDAPVLVDSDDEFELCESAVEQAIQKEKDSVAEAARSAYTCPAHSVAQFLLSCPDESTDPALIGKPGTRVLPPLGKEPDPLFCPQNGEALIDTLTDEITPYESFYVRNNGQIPLRAQSMELGDWTLSIDGLIDNPRTFTMDDLTSGDEFPIVTRTYWMACAGQGRAGYRPLLPGLGGPGDGNQWTVGAVGNAQWTGVLLKDVLESLGLQDSATYVAWYGEDKSCSADPGNAVEDDDSVISRGFELAKAMDNCPIQVVQL